MNERICTTDLRGRGKWSAADLARDADLWVVADTWLERPAVPGKVLAYINPAVLWIGGSVYRGTAGSFADRISGLPLLYGFPDLWVSADGTQRLRALDLTQRGVVRAYIAAVRDALLWADGVEMCYFTSLDFVAPGQYPMEFWTQWDAVLGAIAVAVRGLRPGFLFVGQQFHPTAPFGNTSGLYFEGTGPYEFRYSPLQREMDLATYRALIKWQDPSRPEAFVQEFRKFEIYAPGVLRGQLDWATHCGMYVSVGRDATALSRLQVAAL